MHKHRKKQNTDGKHLCLHENPFLIQVVALMAGAKFVWGEITGWRNKTECFSFHKEKQIPLKKKEEEEEEEEQEQEEQEGETKTKTQWKGEVVNKCLCLPSTSGSLSSYPVITPQVAIVHFKALWCPWKLSLGLWIVSYLCLCNWILGYFMTVYHGGSHPRCWLSQINDTRCQERVRLLFK